MHPTGWNCGTLKFIVLLYRQIIIVPLGGGFVISALKGPQRQQHRIPIKFRFNEEACSQKYICQTCEHVLTEQD